MKLAAKLILIFLLGVLGIVSLFSWQTIRRQNDWEKQRRESHATNLAEALSPTIKQAYDEGGTITIQQAVQISTQKMNGPEVRWLDGKQVASQQPRTTSRQTSSVSITDANGNRKSFSYIPMTLGDNNAGAVEVSEPLAEQDAFTRQSVITSVMSLIGVALLSGFVIYFGGVRLVGRPLGKLISQVNRIGDGELDQEPVLKSNDEFGKLAAAVSQMSHRLREQRDTIRHTDRLGTIGTLAAGMAHELGTPLNVVSGRAGLIKSGKLTSDEIVASAATIQSEADRMTKIIRQLLDFARQQPSPHQPMDLREVVQRTCSLTNPLAEKAKVQLHSMLPNEPIVIDGDAAQIQQVLTNLITNAIDAMPRGGNATVRLYRQSPIGNATDTAVALEVCDTGDGIESRDVSRIFEPFYTTKDVGQGTGLGLSIAYGIIREHGGSIHVASEPNQGTTFTVTLPEKLTSERE